jgi:putative ATPase
VTDPCVEIQSTIKTEENPPVPLHLRNAPTTLMKDLGYGQGYIYNPDVIDQPQLASKQEYLPAQLKGRKFFTFKSSPGDPIKK